MIETYMVPESSGHDTGPGHPESADRFKVLSTLMSQLEQEGLAQSIRTAPAADLSLFRLAHDEAHIDLLENGPSPLPMMLDPDTRLSAGSGKALLGISGAISQIARIAGPIRPNSFLLSRPPGHHALRNRAMGFCIVNTIATLAIAIRKQSPRLRIAIFDFDVHHGNGTEEILAHFPDFLYISTHQYPFYPGTGSGAQNICREDFSGVLDLPLVAGTTDRDYREVFEKRIIPRLSSFSPDVLLISAGFDGHRDDPLGGFLLTEETYSLLGQELANSFPKGFIVSILEGGYNLNALAKSVRSYMEGLVR